MSRRLCVFLVSFALMTVSALRLEARKPTVDSPYKIYVMLGFHASFYHSWRGDCPDEAGFGTDIRVVREIIRMLNESNALGLKARGYWDFDVYWTLEKIIPAYAPDIIEDIRRRVTSGQDEVLPGPYNNGANHAATEEEFRISLAYALENPYGSGLKQLFGRVTPIYRPQEGMYTTGQNRLLLEEGLQGFINYYSNAPFNNVGIFIPALEPKQRYNPVLFRSSPGEKPVVWLPCVSPSDVINHVSLENWLLDLRKLQTSGQVQSDLLLHINFDADAETWLALHLPWFFAQFPNTGGLMEYIHAVNKYPWAEFTVPSQYLKTHPPKTEVLVRQDTADGAFDGNYSWAEKFTSFKDWSELERSRLFTYRAMALSRRVGAKLAAQIDRRLWKGTESSFFQRLIGLSSTHFGMSTPIINEERQAKAETILGLAQNIAANAEKQAALAIRKQRVGDAEKQRNALLLYEFEVYNYSRAKNRPAQRAKTIVRLPVILPRKVDRVTVKDLTGHKIAASLVNVRRLLDGTCAAELMFIANMGPEEHKVYRMYAAGGAGDSSPVPVKSLRNRWLELNLSGKSGIASFKFGGHRIGASRFLRPFITYRSGRKPKKWLASGYKFENLSAERWQGLTRAHLKTRIPMDTPNGRHASELSYAFTMFDDLPYVLVDVQADYAYTLPRNVIQTSFQKLRRLLDLRWFEVAPFQLNPDIMATAQKPLRIWKHNYLDITSYYDLDYGRINPRNRNLDSFNHQVTAGWLAVSNGRLGLLLAENAEALTSLAFCPMRLREIKGKQHLYLNPFGSYFGKQPDYSHLGGNGIGTELTVLTSGALKSNGPSFNGQNVRFSLLLAPYVGDEPPRQLQRDAEAFFYPFGVIYLRTPSGVDAVLPDDIRKLVADKDKEESLLSQAILRPPTALLANPSDGAVDLVWDPARDERVTGYEVRWRTAGVSGWQTKVVAPGHRCRIPDLTNRLRHIFQMRSLSKDRVSSWTRTAGCVPGSAGKLISPLSTIAGISPKTFIKMVYYGLIHRLTVRREQIKRIAYRVDSVAQKTE